MPEHPVLRTNEVHVWRATLSSGREGIAAFWSVLAANERQRANSFHFERDRERFIVARGILRTLLGRYLSVKPEQLCFGYTHFGKPALSDTTGAGGLRFNLSHSGEVALFAFAQGRELGVDIEQVQEDFDALRLAEQFFSVSEAATLLALPAEAQGLAFFNCWTRKEAYIKAIGEGLSHPLNCFDVSLTPGEEATLLCHRNDPNETLRWKIRELSPGNGYAAAIAVEGNDWHLSAMQWSD
ncbi:MAG: 4'-phosphopantetheinyl transferase superfamily protein [Acidobacteria bacterium]|nr:4'-phosphopantetheinyl transferase superfamily protein [Acidobacteriota bacterium]